MSTEYNKSSNYSQTNANRKYLDLYNPPLVTDTLSKQTRDMVITAKYNRRPDLMAHDMFGNANVWWIFTHYNRDILKDPVMDFTAGKTIKAPKNFRPSGVN